MAKVDFGPWDPPVEERDAVERNAARLPSGWWVRCSLGEPSSGIFFVVVEDGSGNERIRWNFNFDRFDKVAVFLEEVARQAEATV